MMWDSAVSQPHDLTFMLIISYGQYGYNSSGALPAADMALEDINSDPDILTGYNLMYDKVRDSMVRQQTILCNNIMNVQKFACWIACSRWDASYDDLVKFFELQTLQERRLGANHLPLVILFAHTNDGCFSLDRGYRCLKLWLCLLMD